MKRGITIEYLKCGADLNFEDDFEVNGAIGTIVTLFCSDHGSVSYYNVFFFKYDFKVFCITEHSYIIIAYRLRPMLLSFKRLIKLPMQNTKYDWREHSALFYTVVVALIL